MRSVAVAVAALLVFAPASAAQDAKTPEGAATIRENWTGAHTNEGLPPHVIVRWAVTVGPGGNPGWIRLRVVKPGERATIVASGPRVFLPAEPGRYEFWAPGIPYDYRDAGIAIDQETGGHAVLKTHADDGGDRWSNRYELYVTDVFRPPLAEDARDVPFTERLKGRQLMISETLEPDVDEDRVGDKTFDTGDLTALHARIVERDREGFVTFAVRVRNNGTTIRHRPSIDLPPEQYRGWGCVNRSLMVPWMSLGCPGGALEPGSEAELRTRISLTGPVPPRIGVRAEGPDLNPADDTVAITPNLTVAAASPRRGTSGVTATVTADAPGAAVVAARIAGVRVARTVRFPVAGAQEVRLALRSREERRRLNRVLRLRGRTTVVVNAASADHPGPRSYASGTAVLRR